MGRTPIRLDKGTVPRVDYNRTIRRGKRAIKTDRGIQSDIMTARKAIGIYRVSQEMNFICEPTLALKNPAYGQKKHGLI